nr:calcium-transporting ATPase 12, plasma membrane-type-like [Ziziphus jujuba var. spinosa]
MEKEIGPLRELGITANRPQLNNLTTKVSTIEYLYGFGTKKSTIEYLYGFGTKKSTIEYLYGFDFGVVWRRIWIDLRSYRNGVEGVAKTLETDIKSGIPDDKKKIGRQRERFGSNTYKKPPSKGLFLAKWRSLQAFAILNDLVNILAACILLLAASIFGNFLRPSLKSKVRNSSENQIEVLRGNKRKKISMYEIVVGDVVCLKIGDEVPIDGLLVEGNNLQVEEDDQGGETVQVDPDKNPFLLSGSIVVNSDYSKCKMMVTTVGMKAKWCEMISQQNCDSSENSRMEDRVRKLTLPILLKVGLPIASIGFLVYLIRYFTGNTKDINRDQEFNHGHLRNFWDSSMLDFVLTAFTIVAVTIVDSLRLSVPVTSFYSKKRMLGDLEMASELSSWENMAFFTTIYTNKTGTLTMNQIKVNKFRVGNYALEEEAYHSNASNCFKILLGKGIALNTSSARNGIPMEEEILSWVVHDLKIDMGVKSKYTVLNHTAFNSQTKRSGVLMKRKEEVDNTGLHVHWKGEAEVILEMCSCYYDISETTNDLVDTQKVEFQRIIQGM